MKNWYFPFKPPLLPPSPLIRRAADGLTSAINFDHGLYAWFAYSSIPKRKLLTVLKCEHMAALPTVQTALPKWQE